MANQNYFMGLDGFVWFVGVVEDRNDPDQLGRVRVRCLGFHTENLVSLPTADLPWAHVMHPVTDPAMHGMGNTPSWLIEGSWVVGFFRDAGEKQQPIIIGSLPGRPANSADYRKGFNDPRHKESTQLNDEGLKQYAAQTKKDGDTSNPTYGPYPLGALKEKGEEEVFNRSSSHTFGESDTNRLARNASHSMISTKDAAVTSNILIANSDQTADSTLRNKGIDIYGNDEKHDDGTSSDGSTVNAEFSVDAINSEVKAEKWNEPKTTDLNKSGSVRYAASYPYNHVFETESGHIKEYDDTAGSERIHEWHRTGTFYEIDADGNKHTRVVGNSYEVIAGTDFVNIKGDVNLTIEANCKTYIKGDWNIEVDGNKTEVVKKNVTETYGTTVTEHAHTTTVNGTHTETIYSTQTSNITGAVTETYLDLHKTDITTTRTETVTGAVTETYKDNQITDITGTLDIDATDDITIDSGDANIHLNP